MFEKSPKQTKPQKLVTRFLWDTGLFSLHLEHSYLESQNCLFTSLKVQNSVVCRTHPHSWACLQLHKRDPWQQFPVVYLGTDLNVKFSVVLTGHSLGQWFEALISLTHFASHYYSGWEQIHFSTRRRDHTYWRSGGEGSTNREQQTGHLSAFAA